MDYLTEKRKYWKSKEGALDRTIWRQWTFPNTDYVVKELLYVG